MSASKKRQETNKSKKKTVLLIFLIVALVAAIASVSAYSAKILAYDKVYEGVYIGETPVGGMSEDELRNKIPELADLSSVYDIIINIDGASEKLSTLSLSPALDVEQMVNLAMEYGRKERGLGRLSEISNMKKNPVTVPYSLSFDEYALQRVLDKISASLDITAVDNKIEIGADSLTITRGAPGRGIVYEEVKKGITNCLINHTDEISLQLKEIEPEEITVDFIKRHTSSEPTDATYTISDHKLLFTQSSPGVTFDDKEVKRALKAEEGKAVVVVPVTVLEPKVTTESLKASLLTDELGTYSSDFSSSSADRAHNIQLACDKINGYILAPGEEFSYNDVVGPRTVERGFRMANVYVGNTVQPGIGGGICQVSSTMFNAVVYADLDITSRRNHTLPVTYVPMGRDATVSYGSVDFKFKNNYSKPIEIRAECIGRKNVITIYGTNERPNRKIEIETEKTGTTSPKVVRKEDSSMPEGKVKVESAGTNGSSYIAYKVVYENGVKISSDVLCKSTYSGKDRVEIVGTKKASPSPSASSTTTAKPSGDPKQTAPAPSAPPDEEPNSETAQRP